MKRIILLFVLAFVIPSALADISLTTDQPSYNLGNKIKASATVNKTQNLKVFQNDAFMRNLQDAVFYDACSFEANFATALNVPELPATASMMGDCAITGELTTNDNSIVEQKHLLHSKL